MCMIQSEVDNKYDKIINGKEKGIVKFSMCVLKYISHEYTT